MDIYIVIVTYNGMSWLKRCLESCNGYRVIVVDNASTDSTVSFIKKDFKDVIVLKQTENLGFGAGNNIGISYALQKGASYVFLLNQDAYLVNDALKSLIEFQKANKRYGILSPIHLNNSQDKLDVGFANYIHFTINPSFISDAIIKKNLECIYDIPFVNAAAWLISKNCLETVGGFDPLFFHYGEDDNYCQRVKFHDFKIGIVTDAYVIHDREHRKKEKPRPYSKEYVTYKERHLKVKLANVNSDSSLDDYAIEEKRIKRDIIKALLVLNFKKLKGKQAEYKSLKNLKNQITKSKAKNRTKGYHYLKV